MVVKDWDPYKAPITEVGEYLRLLGRDTRGRSCTTLRFWAWHGIKSGSETPAAKVYRKERVRS